MQCYQGLAIRLKVFYDLSTIHPDIEFDEPLLGDLLSDYSVFTITDLFAMNEERYQSLLKDAIHWTGVSSSIAA